MRAMGGLPRPAGGDEARGLKKKITKLKVFVVYFEQKKMKEIIRS